MKKVSFLIVPLFLFTSISFSQTVKIGNQVWMTKNLNVDKFRNGDPIPQAKTNEEWEIAGENEQPAWCYYNNNLKNGKKYGKLYNWYAVNDPRGLAPKGWHVPIDEEWTTLIDYLGGIDIAGAKMKNSKGWEFEFASGNGTNESGYLGLPGGHREINGAFFRIGGNSYWWSSTEFNAANAWARGLGHDDDRVLIFYGANKTRGFSVRCMRD